MIFVIDDDQGAREGTASLLRSLGYDVSTYDSARAFLDRGDIDETVSCVITDIMMPEIDGFELHRRLVSAGHRFPIIFLTALADAAANAHLRQCRVHGILTKPCSERSLIDCVESALSGDRSARALGPYPD